MIVTFYSEKFITETTLITRGYALYCRLVITSWSPDRKTELSGLWEERSLLKGEFSSKDFGRF